jgi:hypothetical protein
MMNMAVQWKRALAGAVATMMVSGNASACVNSTNTKALDVVGLKSALMVSALACDQRNEYNQFMTRFQPNVLHAQHVVDAFFRAQHGRFFHRYEDRYVTNVANVQSSAGISQGTDFCNHSIALFGRVLSLKSAVAMEKFAQQQPASQPSVVVTCGIAESSSFRRLAVQAKLP